MEIVPEALRPALFDLLFQIIDFFRGEIERIENGQPLTQTIDSLLQKVNSFIQQIQNGAAAAPAEVPPAAPEAPAPADSGPAAVPGFPYALQIFFDEGAGMENLRAFMLVSTIRDGGSEDSFQYLPADVEHNPDTAAQIVDSGFTLYFRDQAQRDAAIHAVTNAGSVRTYQAIDQEAPHPSPRNISPPRRKSRRPRLPPGRPPRPSLHPSLTARA